MSPEDLQIFAKALARAGSGAALSRVLNVSKQAVWMWASGRVNPAAINVRKMEYYLAGLLDENTPIRDQIPRKEG
jgi:DNA-binding transcriptional regulator YdaS (Cro superfamily)